MLKCNKLKVGPSRLLQKIFIRQKIWHPSSGQRILQEANESFLLMKKRPVLSKKMTRIARSADNYLALEFVNLNSYFNMIDLLPKQYALEITTQSENIYNAQLPSEMSLVIGNERYGISEQMFKGMPGESSYTYVWPGKLNECISCARYRLI